jgi:hypothetical protein
MSTDECLRLFGALHTSTRLASHRYRRHNCSDLAPAGLTRPINNPDDLAIQRRLQNGAWSDSFGSVLSPAGNGERALPELSQTFLKVVYDSTLKRVRALS